MFVFSCTGTYEHRREKICLRCVCENAPTPLHKPASILKYLIYINNKGADKPAWIGGLVSDIVVLIYQRAFFSRRGLHKYELCYENNYLCLYAKNKKKKASMCISAVWSSCCVVRSHDLRIHGRKTEEEQIRVCNRSLINAPKILNLNLQCGLIICYILFASTSEYFTCMQNI